MISVLSREASLASIRIREHQLDVLVRLMALEALHLIAAQRQPQHLWGDVAPVKNVEATDLDRVDAWSWVNALPHGLDTRVGHLCTVVMDQGAVVERGSHEELLALDGRYAQLWQAWQ